MGTHLAIARAVTSVGFNGIVSPHIRTINFALKLLFLVNTLISIVTLELQFTVCIKF